MRASNAISGIVSRLGLKHMLLKSMVLQQVQRLRLCGTTDPTVHLSRLLEYQGRLRPELPNSPNATKLSH
jgi:hypothetical protein